MKRGLDRAQLKRKCSREVGWDLRDKGLQPARGPLAGGGWVWSGASRAPASTRAWIAHPNPAYSRLLDGALGKPWTRITTSPVKPQLSPHDRG